MSIQKILESKKDYNDGDSVIVNIPNTRQLKAKIVGRANTPDLVDMWIVEPEM